MVQSVNVLFFSRCFLIPVYLCSDGAKLSKRHGDAFVSHYRVSEGNDLVCVWGGGGGDSSETLHSNASTCSSSSASKLPLRQMQGLHFIFSETSVLRTFAYNVRFFLSMDIL